MGCVGAPQSAPTSCSDSRQLFDRSAQREGSSAAQPMTEHHRLPRSAAKGTLAEGRLSFGYFALAKQRKAPRPPGRDPASRSYLSKEVFEIAEGEHPASARSAEGIQKNKL